MPSIFVCGLVQDVVAASFRRSSEAERGAGTMELQIINSSFND